MVISDLEKRCVPVPWAWGLGLVSLLLTTGCTDKEALESANTKIRTLEEQVSEVTQAYQKQKSYGDGLAEELGQKIESLEQEVSNLEEQLEEEKGRVQTEKEKHREYVEKYRTSAVGRELDKLQTEDGKVYKAVVIREVDDLGISILHEVGSVKVGFDRLGTAWREEFAYSELAAREQLEIEALLSEQRSAYLAAQDAEYQEQKKKMDKVMLKAEEQRQERLRDAEIARLEALVSTNEAKIRSARQEIWRRESDHASARIHGRISGAAAKVPLLQQTIDKLERQNAQAEARIRFLRSQRS